MYPRSKGCWELQGISPVGPCYRPEFSSEFPALRNEVIFEKFKGKAKKREGYKIDREISEDVRSSWGRKEERVKAKSQPSVQEDIVHASAATSVRC